MQDCQVCGRRFDPLGFQVVVPELGRGFDRVECAQSARAFAPPGSRIAAAPPPAVVRPVAVAGGALAPFAALRPISGPAATAGFLVAGTVAAALLWLRVLGTDQVGYPFDHEAAPPAVAGQTVEADVRPASPPAAVPADRTAAPAPDSAPRVAPPSSSSGETIAAPARDQSSPRLSRQPAGGGGGGGEDSHGNGKGAKEKHAGKGKGHGKHGDAPGSHSPGHGQSNGGGSHASSQGGSGGGGAGKSAGHKGQGHGKKH